MDEELDEPLLRSWVGRTAEAVDIVTPRLVEEFLATFAPHLEPVGGEAPLGLHWCLSPAIVPATGLGPDGHPAKGSFLPPVPLPRRMWAGGEVQTFAPLRIGDTVVRRSRIEDVAVKHGRSGTLCFVSVRHEYDPGRGTAVSERHDIVYRAAAVAGTPPAPPWAPDERDAADLSWAIRADPVLLFRYSAITFNGHRIHYDQPYVTGEEGYPGLVVHGPIQATLLLNLSARLAGRTALAFTYRGLSPMTAGQDFAARGAVDPDGAVRCWTETASGVRCMQSTVPPQLPG